VAHTRAPISLHRWPDIMLTLDQKSGMSHIYIYVCDAWSYGRMCQSVLSVLSEPVVVSLAGAGRSRAVLCIPALATSQGNPRVLLWSLVRVPDILQPGTGHCASGTGSLWA